jgi:outer membrane protein assembly factor BamA
MKKILFLTLVLSVILLSGCNVTKKVPAGEYLLTDYQIKADVKDIPQDQLKEYLRQTPNSTMFGLGPMRLTFYNWAGTDTTKRRNRMLLRVGEPPVIYNQSLTDMSAQQLERLYQNKGYIKAKVTTDVKFKKRKAKVSYFIQSNKPYTVRKYRIKFNDKDLLNIAEDTAKTLVKEGMLFNVDLLNSERERITKEMRQLGYYYFTKEFLIFSADSSMNASKVDITLIMREYQKKVRDSVSNLIFKKYTIKKVIFYTNSEAGLTADIQSLNLDTIHFRNFIQIGPKKKFLSIDALVHNSYINPGSIYNDADIEKTYSALNALGPVKYTNISFRDNNDGSLDCYIIIVPAKTISFSAEAEGTYTDGFWGGAVNINTGNKNVFKGGEQLSAQIRGAMEWQKEVWATELGGKLSLKIPKVIFPVGTYDMKRNLHANTNLNTNINYQARPGEFTVTNFGGGIGYSWLKNKYSNNIDLFDLNYVNFLNIDESFWTDYVLSGYYNKYNYTNHVIMRMGYNGSHTSFNENRPLKNYNTTRYGLESSGNLLYAIDKLFKLSPESDGYYTLFKVRYAQYVRGEYNTTYHQIFDKNNRFVYHAGVGIGIPFGNGDVIPYEKRFYSGGANNIRGWSESTLGPGTYQRDTTVITRDYNQVGDIKLDLNMEYRAKLFWLIEGALFLDAGNIWTIKKYDEQPGGEFKLNSFLSQIAIAYGAGARFDFSFFIFRLDLGVKLYDPTLTRLQRWRVSPVWDDLAFHVAIGYPF